MTHERHTGPWAHPPRTRKGPRFARVLPWALATSIVFAWVLLVLKG